KECLQQDPRCAEAYRMLGELAYRRDQNGWALELLRAATRLDPADKASQILIDVVQRAAEQTAIDGSKTEKRDPLTKLAPIPTARKPKAVARQTSAAVLPSQGRVPGVRMMFIYGAMLGVVGLFGGLYLLGRGGTTPKAKQQVTASAPAAPSPKTEP